MKKPIVFLVLAIMAGNYCAYAQTKNDDILKLLRISGSGKLAEQIVNAMIPEFQKVVPGIPGVFWTRFREKLNVDDLLYQCVPVYDKYYNHDDIKQLIAFYNTPLGKKLVEVNPLLSQETMAIGQKWGEKLGQEIANELIREGYIKNQ